MSDDGSTLASWTDDINRILQSLQENSDQYQKYHKEKYVKNKRRLVVFRIPLIVLSSINSVLSVGLSVYVPQETTSLVNCLLSLFCATISAVELFLGINKKMEQSLMSYHGYKLLGIKIASQLRLEVANRTEDGHEFLTEIMTEYRNLFESSNVLTKTFPDKLLRPIPVLDPINPLLPIVSPRGS
jgi:hypothetical protein